MPFPSLEKSLDKVSNRYLLVVLAAKRARQLNRGANAQVESRHKKPTSVALEEVAGAKVGYRLKEEGEPAKA
jgi:DNA-directed RNA polymerase subunit omega